MTSTLNQIAATCPPLIFPAGKAMLCALKLIALHGPIIFLALNVSKTLLKKRELGERLLTSTLLYFFFINIGTWICPSLSYVWFLAWSVLLGIIGVAIKIIAPATPPEKPSAVLSFPAICGTIVIFLFVLSLLGKGIFNLNYDFDPLFYQLHFAATWLQQGKMSIVPTPFGDPAQAYGPALASIYYLWLMAPLGTDMLAATGAWAFVVLCVLSACALAREIGVRHGYSWAAAMFALMAPFFVHEASGALSDLPVAGFFTASLYFFLTAIRKKSAIDLALALLSAGLMIGSKYTGATLLLILIPPALFASWTVRGRWAWLAWSAGIILGCAGGGVWYLRNLIFTGNPFFPIRISIGSRELFPGLYGRDLMVGWIFHKEGVKAWFQVVEANVSFIFIALGMTAMVVFFLTGLKIIAGKHSETMDGQSNQSKFFKGISSGVNSRLSGILVVYVALAPVMIDRLNWHVVPYQEERFWISIIPLISAIAAAVFSRRPALLFATLALAYGGVFVRAPEHSIINLKAWDWIKVAAPGSAVAGIGLGWLIHGRILESALFKKFEQASFSPYIVAVICAFLMMVTVVWGLRGHEQRRLKASMFYPFATAWTMVPCPDEGVTVAYTGSNVPYLLHGPRLNNKVVYVSSSGLVTPKDHEVLRDFSEGPPRFMTPQPEISRIYLCPRKWAEAVISSGAELLFVTRLGRNDLLNIVHSKSGWPIEDEWARSASLLFRKVFEDGVTRIYQVDRLNKNVAASLPEECERRPADAIIANWESPDDRRHYFPGALKAIQDMKILEGEH